MGFDGRSATFEIDGRKHSIRLGTPGREIYIDNHPFAAQFGGPAIAVLLDDGCIYHVHLSGPSPQVIIGDIPAFDVFRKSPNIRPPSPDEFINRASLDLKRRTENLLSPTSLSLQDIDMRVKPNTEANSVINSDNSFYFKDMKDVDWRHVQQLKSTESDIKEQSLCTTRKPRTIGSWHQEERENNSRISYEKKTMNQVFLLLVL